MANTESKQEKKKPTKKSTRRKPSGNLVIVESPSKAKTLGRYLGKGFEVLASKGHVLDLPKSKLGVDIENQFEPQYIPIRGKAPLIKGLKKAAKEAEKIFLATDPDREGEAIAWHLKGFLQDQKDEKDLLRLRLTEITQRGIQEALAHPQTLNMSMVNAQQARRVLDRLVGYGISPILWKHIRGGLSAGRVQSVALRLVYEREKEIESFKPTEYWTIEADFATDSGEIFRARLVRLRGEKPQIPNEAEAKALCAGLEKTSFRITSVQQKERQKKPPFPFTTSKLQQEAYQQLRFNARKTMSVAQQLYEGVELGREGPVGLITYMRTDSRRVAPEAKEEAARWIETTFGSEYLTSGEERAAQPSKMKVQDAHEAIRPTSVFRTPDEVKPHLTNDQFRLYQLIWRNFLASQMNSARFQDTQVTLEGGEAQFRANGMVLLFDGFLKIYQESELEEEKEEENETPPGDNRLPLLKEGQTPQLRGVFPEQHFTQPPPRYTDATMVKRLEELGIGRPSTYAPTLSTLQTRGYVRKENGRYHLSDLGRLIAELLIENFPNILDYAFTAKMEEELDQVENGDVDWREVVKGFYEPFREVLAAADREMASQKKHIEQKTDIACEECGAPMVVKWGRHGKFLACSTYPKCRTTRTLKETTDGSIAAEAAVEEGEFCPTCGAPMGIRSGRFGRFLACTRYPECKTTKPVTLKIPCPLGCGGELVMRRARRGNAFYGCSRYPECRFLSWNKPVLRTCPACNHPYLVEKYTKTTGPHLACPNKECTHQEPLPAAVPSET